MVVARTEVAEKPGCVCCVWVWVSGWLFWVHVLASSIGDSIWMRRCCFWLVSLGLDLSLGPATRASHGRPRNGAPRMIQASIQGLVVEASVALAHGTMHHT